MTMARFARGEVLTYPSRGDHPAFMVFIWTVNEIRPHTFGRPTRDEDRPGYDTEHYPGARVIHGPADEGIRIVADDPQVAAAFHQAANRLGIHLVESIEWLPR